MSSRDHERRVAAVLEAAERAPTLAELLPTTLAAIDEHLGVANSAFMLVLDDLPRAYAGVRHGGQPYAIEEYFERWADDFLRRHRTSHEFAFRVPAGTTAGYITVLGSEELCDRARGDIRALVDPLSELLRGWLPRGIHGVLSPRESAVAELVAFGLSNRQIGSILHVEEDTVKKHVSHALTKFGQRRRTELAVSWAIGAPLAFPRSIPPAP